AGTESTGPCTGRSCSRRAARASSAAAALAAQTGSNSIEILLYGWLRSERECLVRRIGVRNLGHPFHRADDRQRGVADLAHHLVAVLFGDQLAAQADRKSTRLNS